METRDRLKLSEAIEDLSAVVDYEDWEREIELLEEEGDDAFHYKKISWLRDEPYDEAVSHLKRIFGSIYRYLREIESEDYSELRRPQSQKGIRSMVVLVGEAARRLDRYTQLFHGAAPGSISRMDEVHKIQHFYHRKIEPKVQAEFELVRADELDELQKVQRDIDYELLSLFREGGQAYLDPALIDQIKLAISLRGYAEEEYVGDDPLIEVQLWRDKMAQVMARNLLTSIRPVLRALYPVPHYRRDDEMVAKVSDALVALMLAANRDNLLSRGPIKSSWEYFRDFQMLLRGAYSTPEYRKLASYDTVRSKFYQAMRELNQTLCFNLYTQMHMTREMLGVIDHIVLTENKDGALSKKLTRDCRALVTKLEGHPNGPLFMAFDQLMEANSYGFDPLLAGNLPERLCEVEWGDSFYSLLRIPSPTTQVYIHKAKRCEEFRIALRGMRTAAVPQKLLVIDLADRTSWKEYARVKALEEFADVEEALETVSLAKQSDFYHQVDPYDEIDHWPLFRASIIEQVSSEGSGYRFPESVAKRLFPEFLEGVVGHMHTALFEGKERLSREERCEFIDILHFFIELKLLDIVGPDFFSFTSKDSLDIGCCESVQFLAIWQLLSKGAVSPALYEWLRAYLLGPTLLVRERAPNEVYIARTIRAVRRIEEKGTEIDLDLFYSKPIAKGEVIAPIASDESL